MHSSQPDLPLYLVQVDLGKNNKRCLPVLFTSDGGTVWAEQMVEIEHVPIAWFYHPEG